MANIDTDPKKIDEVLTRGVHSIYTKEELRKKLLSGNQLHLKLGIDVTGPNQHLGHSVIQRKLRDFQELGHRVTLIIGDFTTLVGDHSDKVDMRDETSTEEIKKNEETYKDQFFKTVMKELTEVRHNSEWLKGLNFNDVISLAKQFTVQQMLDREAFMLRYNAEKPIGLDEFLYPLMQGYDSVALKCDVELGGTDQTFNLLAGRKLMPVFGLEPQCAIAMKLLVGSDGRPMGKSLKNFIPVNDNANDMYGKIMSIVDNVIWDYFELVTRVPMDEVEQMRKEVENGANPMEFKKRLAREIVTFYHSAESADAAEENFRKTVQNKEISEEVEEFIVTSVKLPLSEVVKQSGFVESGKEAHRLIEQGGVSYDGQVISDPKMEINVENGKILKVGKRKFGKVVLNV